MSARRALLRRLRSGLLAGFFAALAALFRLLPWAVAQGVGRLIGRLGWLIARRDRRRALEHLSVAFPETTPQRRLEVARECFLHLGTTLAECLWISRRRWPAVRPHVEVVGWEHVEAARADQRPVIVLTGHCGNWELLAATISCSGLPLAVVARQIDAPALDRILVGLRGRFGTRTIARGSAGAARALLRTLRDGAALGMLIDQDTDVDGAWVPFFGRPAYTPLGAAQLALRQGCLVLPCFIERLPDGGHLAVFQESMGLPEDALAATAAMSQLIEAQVRRRPEQWVWMHRRWRRQPPVRSAAGSDVPGA